MSIIKGRFIYHAYYKSVNEMKADKDLEEGYFVSVIDGSEKKDFKILKDKPTTAGESFEVIVNGLYAVPVIIVNESTTNVPKPYKTNGPLEIDVGFLKEGQEFSANDTNDVFNLMFYEHWCTIKVTTNFEGIQVRGENHVLRYVEFEVVRANSNIVKEVITVGADKQILEEEWVPQSVHRFTYDKVFTTDLPIVIKLTSELGEELTLRESVPTQYPTYNGIITPSIEPSPVVIKTMPSTYDNDFVVTGNYFEQGLFLAVPPSKKLISIIDENGIDIKADMRNYPVTIMYGSTPAIYTCYMTKSILANDVDFRIITEEV